MAGDDIAGSSPTLHSIPPSPLNVAGRASSVIPPDNAFRANSNPLFLPPSPPSSRPIDLISYTPFGAFCRRCQVPVSLGKTCLRTHLDKHPTLIFSGYSKEDFVLFAERQLERAKGFNPSLFLSGPTFSGFLCSRCGVCFRRKDNSRRHAMGKNVTCLLSDIVATKLSTSLCGRLISTTNLLAAKAPTPLGASIPYANTGDWLDKYVPADEKGSQYLSLFHPLSLQGNLDDTISTMVDSWSNSPGPDEGELSDLLERSKEWLFNRARYDTAMIPANYRAAIQVFDGQDVGEVSVNYTYNFRHFEANLFPELSYMLCFIWRRLDETKARTTLGKIKKDYNLLRDNPFCTAHILQELFVEEVLGFFQQPLVVEYCLARLFRKRAGELTMVKCDLSSSQIAASMSLLRAGTCSHLCSFHAEANLFAPMIVRRVRTSRVANILCPFIRHLKEMHARKGNKRMKTVSPEGDISVDGYEFPRRVWSKLIYEVLGICKCLLSRLLVGDGWSAILDISIPICIESFSHERVGFRISPTNGPVFSSTQVLFSPSPDSMDYDRLATFLSIGFFGCGGGATRGTEISELLLSQASWHRNTVYYTTTSNKQFSFRSRSIKKSVEHKLPAVLARCFLLFRLLSNQQEQVDLKSLVPSRVSTKHSMNDAITELFNFASVPSTTQIRQFFTAVSDVLFPSSNWDGVLSATSDVAQMSAHSASTHQASYGSSLINGRELLYRVFHRELGGDVPAGLATTAVPLSKQELAHGLCALLGPEARYTCAGQERLVDLIANSVSRHAHIGLPCGSGKSMAWMVPTVARILAGRTRKTIFVVLPYKFLVEYHLEAATKMSDLTVDLSILAYSGIEISQSAPLPTALHDIRLFPDILFLSLEAMVNLMKFHSPTLKSWVSEELIQRFIIDEVHTILGESFRQVYEFLPSLVRYEIPVATMSGTLPNEMVPFLLSYLGMSSSSSLDDVDIIQTNDCLGYFPDDFVFSVQESLRPINAAGQQVGLILRDFPQHCIHIMVDSKNTGESVFKGLCQRYDCRFVTSHSSAEEQANVAREWSLGKFQVLVSTTIALVGNENADCHHVLIIGYLYSLMNVIQAMGRLRPSQRLGGASIRIYLPPINDQRLDGWRTRETVGFDALRNRKLIADDQILFKRVATNSGLYEWLVKDEGCRIKNLARRYGFQRPQCRFCDICRGRPIRRLATAAESSQQCVNTKKNLATLVLKQLSEKCFFCGEISCDGDGCLGNSCYRCGKQHYSKNCREPKAASNVLNGRACYHCFDYYARQGYTNHDVKTCPLKRRLRRMVFDRANSSKTKFLTFLNTIYSDEASFYKFVASLEPVSAK